MPKRAVLGLFIIVFTLFSASCAYYEIVKQTELGGDARSYQTVSVGWLDLGEEKWKDYGFEEKNKDDWKTLVLELNLKSLPEFLKRFLPQKTIFTAPSKSREPRKEGLLITFTEVNYAQRTSSGAQIAFGSFAGSDTLDLTIHFTDAQTGNELGQVTVSLQSKAGTGYSSYGFEGRVTNSVYNLARYLGEVLN